MPDHFELPTTPEQWAAVAPNETDISCAERHMRYMNDGHEPYAPAVYGFARGMAASRLLERERCVMVMAGWLSGGAGNSDQHPELMVAEARRILEGNP